MSQPITYTRTTDFAGEEASNVGGRSTVRTAQVNAELDAVSTTLGQTLTNLAILQRDDTKLRDGIVELHALSSAVLALIAATGVPRGAWLTATSYAVQDLVSQSGNVYICVVAHTSGTFATDLAAGKWMFFAVGTGVAASSITFAPTATLAATNAQAAIEEADTENRALIASTSSALSASIAAIYASTTDSAKGAALIGYLRDGTGADGEMLLDFLKRIIYPEQFGAVGDWNGTSGTDDTAAFQRTIDYVESLLGSSQADDTAIRINLAGRRYRIAGTLTTVKGGFAFVGAGGRGTQLVGPGLMFDINNATTRLRAVEFRGINFFSSDAATTAAAIRLYRTVGTKITDCLFQNFGIGVDCYQASTTHLRGVTIINSARTAQATAGIRLQGLDLSLTGDSYTPGGGMHITDLEILGAASSGLYDTTAGLDVKSADGLYMLNVHATGCVYTVYLNPDATAANRVISEVHGTQIYCDEPSTIAANPRCVFVGGTVKEFITTAAGGTVQSLYQGIRMTNVFCRGNNEADFGVFVSVTDGDSWWDYGTRKLRDLVFIGGAMRQCTVTGFKVQGASVSRVEPYNVTVLGMGFSDNGSSNPSGTGIDAAIEAESITYVNNTHDTSGGTSSYIVLLQATDAGNDSATPCVVATGNNLMNANGYSAEPLRVSPLPLGAAAVIANNLLPGPGSDIKGQVYKIATTDATATTIFSHLALQGQSGVLEAVVVGSTSDGARTVSARLSAHFHRDGSSTRLSSVTTDVYDPDAEFATDPTIDLSTNTVRVRIVGIAATSIQWSCAVRMLTSR